MKASNFSRLFTNWAKICTVGLFLGAMVGSVEAGDAWTQWGGANRDFKTTVKKLATSWPEEGPKKLWSRKLGRGYSTVVSDGSTLYTTYGVRDKNKDGTWEANGEEVIIALDAKTGKTLWEHRYDVTIAKGLLTNYGPGPRSTPLLIGDKLYTVGFMLDVNCLDAKNGKVVWSKNMAAEYDVKPPDYGYGASPLLYKNLIIMPVGGEAQSIVALNAKTGNVAWKNQSFGQTYSSPFIIDLDGEDQLITFAPKAVMGLNPESGELIWSHPQETQYGANISTPVWCDDNILFISSAYGMGARGIKLARQDGKTTAEELWYNKKVKIHHANAIAVGDHVYCSVGDFGPAFMAAINVKTGKLAWRKRGFSKATLIKVNDEFIALDEDGKLGLLHLTPKTLKVISKTEVCKRIAWTAPSIVGSSLIIRDHESIIALDLQG